VNSRFDPSYYGRLHELEGRHFWFRARSRVISTVVSQLTSQLEEGFRVLEVGCGTGGILNVLDDECRRGHVFGMDLFHEGLCFASKRTQATLVQGDIHRRPFDASFDVVGAFDVIEHLADDTRALRSLAGLLKPGGAVIVTVPAEPSFFSYFDRAVGHYRRYTKSSLTALLARSGFAVEYATHYMTSIYPLVWLGRRLAPLRKKSETYGDVYELAMAEFRIPPVVNDLLAWILSQEARVIARRRPLPFGTSLLAIARVRSTGESRLGVATSRRPDNRQ
jgi:SAM-dependent methyltransferase